MFRLSWTEEFFVLLTTLQLSKSEVGLVLEDPLNVPPVLLRLATSPLLTFTIRFPSHQRVHLALKHHHIIESIIYKMFIHQLIQIQNYCRMQNIDTTLTVQILRHFICPCLALSYRYQHNSAFFFLSYKISREIFLFTIYFLTNVKYFVSIQVFQYLHYNECLP